MASTITIGANNVKYDNSGTSAFPKLSIMPTAMLPTSAPFKLPMPPTMTTTNARGSRSRSMPAYPPRIGPPITPPNAARPAPAANTPPESSDTLTPVAAAISGSSTTARSTAPTSAATTMTNNRYFGKTMSAISIEPRNGAGYGSANGSPPQIMNAASR